MKCANCGNDDERMLWDEGDTIYCSKCCHRTSFETGKDDLVECPYCHYMRDRKAFVDIKMISARAFFNHPVFCR